MLTLEQISKMLAVLSYKHQRFSRIIVQGSDVHVGSGCTCQMTSQHLLQQLTGLAMFIGGRLIIHTDDPALAQSPRELPAKHYEYAAWDKDLQRYDYDDSDIPCNTITTISGLQDIIIWTDEPFPG